MYTLINGSPKPYSSNSMHFLNVLSKNLNKYNLFELKKNAYDEILADIKSSEVIVFAFPLYVDSPSSITLEFLDYIMDKKIKLKNKLIYIIINCGFREGKQNITAINIMKQWCKKVNATYGCSILIGAGEIVGKDKYKFISKKATKSLIKFSNIVKQKQHKEDILTTMDILNNKLYVFLANKSWNKKGKKNNLTKKDLEIT